MNFKIGDPSIVDQLNTDQLKDYWYELKMMRYDSHFYLKLLERIKALNPNLVMPDTLEMERFKSEALGLALWEENWEIRNRERIKNGGIDYSLFRQKDNVRRLEENRPANISANA